MHSMHVGVIDRENRQQKALAILRDVRELAPDLGQRNLPGKDVG